MTVNALLLGSIGVIAETSDMQRVAFNAAFAEAGLDWEWTADEYQALLKKSGGEKRITEYALARHQTVDAAALHKAKEAQYERILADVGLRLRPGVRDLMDEAANRAIPVAWVTDTSEAQMRSVLDNLGGSLHADEFHFIGSTVHVENRKPAPDIYDAALTYLRVAASEAIAVEDTGICAEAALNAGIRTYGYPNEYAELGDFADEVIILDEIGPELLDEAAAALRNA